MVVWTEESRGGSGGPFNLLIGRSTNERLLSLSLGPKWDFNRIIEERGKGQKKKDKKEGAGHGPNMIKSAS